MNIEERREYGRKWRASHAEHIREYQRIYRDTPQGKEVIRRSNQKRLERLGRDGYNRYQRERYDINKDEIIKRKDEAEDNFKDFEPI